MGDGDRGELVVAALQEAPFPHRTFRRAEGADQSARSEVLAHAQAICDALEQSDEASAVDVQRGLIWAQLATRLEICAEEYGAARSWLRRAADMAERAGDIADPTFLVVVAGDIFGPPSPYFSGWETSPGFLVVSPDQEDAATALQRAANRFQSVAEDGRIIEAWEVTDLATPNWVSNVSMTPAGPITVADTKGELPTAMGERMLKILTEELSTRSIAAHVTSVPRGLQEQREDWAPSDWKLVEVAAGSPVPDLRREPTAIFLCTRVRRGTRDGRQYDANRYWRSDGTWTEDRAEAETFEDWPNDLVAELRRTQDPRITAVRLPADPNLRLPNEPPSALLNPDDPE